MNLAAAQILERIAVRRRLLSTIDVNGYVEYFPDSGGLCRGHVGGCMALVPLEHATIVPASALQKIRARGIDYEDRNIRQVMDIRNRELEVLNAEEAWIRECA